MGLNVEASCHTLRRRLPPSTNSAVYQWPVSSTRQGPSQLSVLHLAAELFTARDGAILADNRDFCIIHLPPLGGPRPNIDTNFGTENYRVAWLPDGKKIEDFFIHFDRIHERDRRTERRTDRQTDRQCVTAQSELA